MSKTCGTCMTCNWAIQYRRLFIHTLECANGKSPYSGQIVKPRNTCDEWGANE